jgi:hypothetical protein
MFSGGASCLLYLPKSASATLPYWEDNEHSGPGQSMNRRIFIFLLGICAVFSAPAVGPAGRLKP